MHETSYSFSTQIVLLTFITMKWSFTYVYIMCLLSLESKLHDSRFSVLTVSSGTSAIPVILWPLNEYFLTVWINSLLYRWQRKQITLFTFWLLIKYQVLTWSICNLHKCQARINIIIPISHWENWGLETLRNCSSL